MKDIGRREEPAEEAVERTREGSGILVGLLRAESTESLLSLAALLLLTEKAVATVAAAALVGAPKLGIVRTTDQHPARCTPTLQSGDGGNHNPRIPRVFCATPPTPKYAPDLTPADEEEEVDSSSVRPTRPPRNLTPMDAASTPRVLVWNP